MRLFFAITLDQETKDALAQFLVSIKPYVVNGRFTPADNLHLTLVFIGETNKLPSLKTALDKLIVSPFSLSFTDLGFFRRPGGDIIWLRAAGDHLAETYNQLRDALCFEGYQLEKRPFKPHITLGRKMTFAEGISLASTSPPKISPMKVNKVSLMQSLPIGAGVKYKEVHYRELL